MTRKRPTLNDVAEHAGVSRALVSIVMRDVPGASAETRTRVRAAAAELGYRPDTRARLLRQDHSRLLGVAFAAGEQFHADLVDGIYVAAERLGYDVVLSAVTPRRNESRTVRTLVDDRCEAVLLLGSQLPARQLQQLAEQVPVVALARRVRVPGVDSVHSDDAGGARSAVDHLLGLGHRKIVHIDGGRAPGAADRRRGYLSAMRRAGLGEVAEIVEGGPTEEFGARAAHVLLTDRSTAPSALFAFNDRSAVGALDVLIRSGHAVPQSISVVGFDDSALARLAHIDLTTVAQDADQLSALAVARAVDRVESAGPLESVDLVVAPHLVARGTSSAI